MDNKRGIRLISRLIVMIIAIALISLGLFNGGFNDVKNKAVMICYECIGIR